MIVESPQAGQGAASPPAAVSPAPPGQPGATAPPPLPKTLVRSAVPEQPAAAEPSEPVSVVLRLPEGDPAKGETLHQAVEPGQRERVLALIRNQSGIVDNYDIRVEGMPQDWWSVYPGTVYLVPFGAGGTYEQEVEIHLHPPRGPEAEARVWDLMIVADSKAMQTVAASAPLALHVQPYIETATTLRPQRKKGRRKVTFDVTVANKANAPVLIALEGEDEDAELKFGFNRPPSEIPAGAAIVSQMQVRPPKQIWIGRGRDWRLEVKTITGDEAAERAADQVVGADVLLQAGPPVKKKWYKRGAPQVPGMYPPRVFKPQLYPPDVSMGPGGLQVRMPKLQQPQFQGPQMKSMNASQLKPGQLKLPGRGGSSTPTAPLMPTQGVFKQKPWLPWWLIPLLLLLLLLLFLLLRSQPQTVLVPKVVGAKSTFDAQARLIESGLRLDPETKTQIDDTVPPGSVLRQAPDSGVEAPRASAVSVLVAVGSGHVKVPDVSGRTAAEADKLLRARELTLGPASPQPVDPDANIKSQIPAAGETVKAGAPISLFYAPKPDGGQNSSGKPATPPGDPPMGDGGTKNAAAVVIPAAGGATPSGYAKRLSDLALVPVVQRVFDEAPRDHVVATRPAAGTTAARGREVRVIVSAGIPRITFSDGDDVLLVDGATGKRLGAVAAGAPEEADPTWAPDATRVAYVSDGRVRIADTARLGQRPRALTPGSDFSNLAWSPRGDVIAAARGPAGDTDLCLLTAGERGVPSCKLEPSFELALAMHWAPDGRSILAVGRRAGSPTSGIVRWTTARPFSSNAGDWSAGEFMSDVTGTDRDVADVALSPDGKRLSAAVRFGSDEYRLWLTDADDLGLERAKRTGLRACKLAWRGDSLELALTQADRGCLESQGALVRVDPRHPDRTTHVAAKANDPSYAPETPTSG
ncbi:PASTA domain-containing protein [Solirubrobacter ginsenosidimutans]|uniref:PASTA domain-containing protein n=1 Tax=Solirubrobacter ginsenosidimutans TaxID=490573 RepID=A0A9X3RZT3_9ACTN|nr:PASTA domain-containing protein [Solirubrobacter ginsenosidimutans]MDA0161265.1 PASTA domain-containing protein [Solirubrobacter ginsenosidimutans]